MVDSGLNELELQNIDAETGKPPTPSRLKDVKSADAIYQSLKRADDKSASDL
jgi:hypothetical protein